MLDEHLLKTILRETRDVWDRPTTRAAVRENFAKVLACGTLALGGDVFTSGTQEKVVCHTCKSRACPGCGYRNTISWQRELYAALPEIPYTGIVLTMPCELWPIFKHNRHMLQDLPSIGAKALQGLIKAKYGVRVLMMVIPHTFGGYLNFNCHLHIMMSAGGMQENTGEWTTSLGLCRDEMMRYWRLAVITYLRMMERAKMLSSGLTDEELTRLFTIQYSRRWQTYVHNKMSKRHFLGYAARYARRLPIAQRRILRVADGQVVFTTKDKRRSKENARVVWVDTVMPVRDFVAALSEHVQDRYRHAIRYFGLLAPKSRSKTFAALFMVLGQKPWTRPRRLSWRESLKKYFDIDPLVDASGQLMQWNRRLKPLASQN